MLTRIREPETAPPWGAAAGLSLLAAYVVFQIAALAVVTTLMEPDAVMTGAPSPMTTGIAATLAAALAFALLLSTLRRGAAQVAVSLRLGDGYYSLWIIVLFSLGMAITVDLVALATNTAGLPLTLRGLGADPLPWVVAALFTIVAQPVVETLLLQGVWYPALAARLGNLQAVALTAVTQMILVAFPPADPGDPALWIEALLAGLYISLVRAHEGSTRSAIVARGMFGAFLLARALLLPAAGAF